MTKNNNDSHALVKDLEEKLFTDFDEIESSKSISFMYGDEQTATLNYCVSGDVHIQLKAGFLNLKKKKRKYQIESFSNGIVRSKQYPVVQGDLDTIATIVGTKTSVDLIKYQGKFYFQRKIDGNITNQAFFDTITAIQKASKAYEDLRNEHYNTLQSKVNATLKNLA